MASAIRRTGRRLRAVRSGMPDRRWRGASDDRCSRARSGSLVGVASSPCLSSRSSGSGRSTGRRPTAPSELARAGIPVERRGHVPRRPRARRGARGTGRGRRSSGSRPTTRPRNTARPARTASAATSRPPAAAPAPAAAGSARSRSTPSPTTGSRRSPPTRTPPYVYVLTTRYGADKPCSGQLPDAVHRAADQLGRRRDLGAGKPLCACKGSGQFDPIIEVVPEHRRGLRAVHERLQRHVHEVDRPRRDLVGARQDLRQRVVERQADPRGQRRRPGRVHRVQRPDRRRPVDRPVARLRRDLDAGASSSTRNRYDFAFDARRRSGRHRLLRRDSTCYGGGGNKGTTPDRRRSRSTSSSRATRGATWTDRLGRARSSRASPASPTGCPPDFYLGHTALTADAAGKLVLAVRRRDDGRRPPDDLRARARRTRARRGRAARSSRRPARRRRRRRSSRAAPATSAPGTADAGGGNVDAWNVWYRTLDRRRRHVGGAGEDLRRDGGAAVQDRGRASPRSTATTARSRSPTPARRSRSGARARATTARRGLVQPPAVRPRRVRSR